MQEEGQTSALALRNEKRARAQHPLRAAGNPSTERSVRDPSRAAAPLHSRSQRPQQADSWLESVRSYQPGRWPTTGGTAYTCERGTT